MIFKKKQLATSTTTDLTNTPDDKKHSKQYIQPNIRTTSIFDLPLNPNKKQKNNVIHIKK